MALSHTVHFTINYNTQYIRLRLLFDYNNCSALSTPLKIVVTNQFYL